MRVLLVALVLGVPLLASGPGAATHAQLVEGRYVLGSLLGVDDTPLGTSWCITQWATDDELGCLGGGDIHTHAVDTISQAGDDCAATPELCHTYKQAETALTDALSGPNVHAILCMQDPQGGTFCGGEDDPDGIPDATANGCGITLKIDATDIHAGDHHVFAYAFLLHVDSSTNAVCVGTNGVFPVFFS